jgi:hypothetical protein
MKLLVLLVTVVLHAIIKSGVVAFLMEFAVKVDKTVVQRDQFVLEEAMYASPG